MTAGVFSTDEKTIAARLAPLGHRYGIVGHMGS
jgi:hypothetical protein